MKVEKGSACPYGFDSCGHCPFDSGDRCTWDDYFEEVEE